MNQDFECPRCGRCCKSDLARVGEVGVWGTVQCEPQEAVTEDGWCDWVCPKPTGYLMQCCDCELIHEVDFRVVRYESEDSEVYEVVDDPNLQAQMRLKRRDDISPKKPQQKPVAWITNGGKGELWWYQSSKFDEEGNLIGPNPDDIPLYAAPPKKEWVGLTDQEINSVCYKRDWTAPWTNTTFARAIEAKLREKNQ
jgi:hypothetical protein